MTCRISFIARWLLLCALIVASCPAGLGRSGGARSQRPTYRLDGHLLVKAEHLSRHPLDKEISERCLNSFLKALDPMKVYFYQSDIDEFMKHKDELCDSIRKGDIGFAYTVFRTFLQRVDERVKTVNELLAGPLDFTTDEQMVVNRDTAQYPRTAAEAVDRWRQRIKYDILILKSADKEDKKEGKEARDKLTRRYNSFAKRMHQINSEELLEMYLNAFTMSFDPHTDYMSPDTQKNFAIAMSLELEGIGASLMSEDGYTVGQEDHPRRRRGQRRPDQDRRQDHRRRARTTRARSSTWST